MTWKDDMTYAMAPIKFLTMPYGGWPLQEYNKFALARHIVCSIGATVAMIIQYLELYYDCTGVCTKIDTLTILVCSTLGLLKITWFRIYSDNLISNYSSAVDDYRKINAEKREIMRQHASLGRSISIIAILIAYVDSVIFIVGHTSTSVEEFQGNTSIEGLRVGYAIPSTCVLTHFYISAIVFFAIYAVQCVTLVIICLCNHGSDSVFLNITLHVCGQLKILKINFTSFDVTKPKAYERFKALIARHDHLITMASKLAETISFVLLIQLFLSSVLICILGEYAVIDMVVTHWRKGFQIIVALKTNDFGMISKSIFVLAAFLAQLLVYSMVGDHLKTQMEEIGLSVYQSTWYELPTKVTKNIVFIMMWNQLPIKLQAGGFVVVDLATFMSIVKTSMSYLSVLRVMIEI